MQAESNPVRCYRVTGFKSVLGNTMLVAALNETQARDRAASVLLRQGVVADPRSLTCQVEE